MSADHDRLLAEIDDLLGPGVPEPDWTVSEEAMRWSPSEQAEHPEHPQAPAFRLVDPEDYRLARPAEEDDRPTTSRPWFAGLLRHDPASCGICRAGMGFLFPQTMRAAASEAQRRMLLQGSITFTVDAGRASPEFLDVLTGGWWTANRSGWWSLDATAVERLLRRWRTGDMPELAPASVKTVMARACPDHRPAGAANAPAGIITQQPATLQPPPGSGPSARRGLDGRRRPPRRLPRPARSATRQRAAPPNLFVGLDPAGDGQPVMAIDRSDGVNRWTVIDEPWPLLSPGTLPRTLNAGDTLTWPRTVTVSAT